MHIEQLILKNYRNYEDLNINFANKVNVILGENAQGKTNVIEAIYVLALVKSHRTNNDKDLIKWDEEYAKIEGNVMKRNGQIPLQLVVSNKGKQARLNHIDQKKLSDYIGNINVVMFAPEDLNLVKGSPQLRRRFIDMEIGQISPRYLHDISTYQKVMRQRNSYLKALQTKQKQDLLMLDVLTEQYVDLATKIVFRRFEFLKLLEEIAKPIHKSISRGGEQLKLIYKPSVNVSEDDQMSKMIRVFQEKYEEVKKREIERGVTMFGPHRDDLQFLINDRDVQTFGSQGQQRTTALSVKLAEIELIKAEIGEYPILLLDDVLSELDNYRQSLLLNAIQNKVQTFVTTTNIDGIDHKTLTEAAIYEVVSGIIKQVQ